MKPLKEILSFLGGWPLNEGEGWNEDGWQWEESILKLREFISKRTNNIFSKEKDQQESDKTVFITNRERNSAFKMFGFFL